MSMEIDFYEGTGQMFKIRKKNRNNVIRKK